MGDAITEEYFSKQGRSDRLYGTGFGADQADGADFTNAESPRGASVADKHPPKSPGSIQGAHADKPKPRGASAGKTPTLAQDTAALKEGNRADTVEKVAKRGQRVTKENAKKSERK